MSLCDCGGHKTGYADFSSGGHSTWCKVHESKKEIELQRAMLDIAAPHIKKETKTLLVDSLHQVGALMEAETKEVEKWNVEVPLQPFDAKMLWIWFANNTVVIDPLFMKRLSTLSRLKCMRLGKPDLSVWNAERKAWALADAAQSFVLRSLGNYMRFHAERGGEGSLCKFFVTMDANEKQQLFADILKINHMAPPENYDLSPSKK